MCVSNGLIIIIFNLTAFRFIIHEYRGIARATYKNDAQSPGASDTGKQDNRGASQPFVTEISQILVSGRQSHREFS